MEEREVAVEAVLLLEKEILETVGEQGALRNSQQN